MPASPTIGVVHPSGDDPDSIPSVRSSDADASTHQKRPDGVAFALQVRAHPVNASLLESTDILKQCPTGSKLAHKPGAFAPKPRSGPGESCAFPRDRDVLTGKSSADEVDSSSGFGSQPGNRLG
jgi:hypothetical protein